MVIRPRGIGRSIPKKLSPMGVAIYLGTKATGEVVTAQSGEVAVLAN